MIGNTRRALRRIALLIIGLSAPFSLNAATPRLSRADCPAGQLPLYSHNDYRSGRPLHDALDAGFRGIEVDLFLVDGVLRPGHSRREARRARSFEEMYVEPLDSLARSCRGAAWLANGTPLLLLLEIKEASTATYDSVFSTLERHRELFVAAGRDTVTVSPSFTWMLSDCAGMTSTSSPPVATPSLPSRWCSSAGCRRRPMRSIEEPRHSLVASNACTSQPTHCSRRTAGQCG